MPPARRRCSVPMSTDYGEVWVNGEMPRAAGRPSPGCIQGFNMPNRVVLADQVNPGDSFEIAIFAINGPISEAPANYLFVGEATVGWFRRQGRLSGLDRRFWPTLQHAGGDQPEPAIR